MMNALKGKLTGPQILFTSLFTATVVTSLNYLIEWEQKIYAGLMGGLTAIVGAAIAKMMIKNKG